MSRLQLDPRPVPAPSPVDERPAIEAQAARTPAVDDPPPAIEAPIGDADSLQRFRDYRPLHDRTRGWFALQAAMVWDSLLTFQTEQQVEGHLLEIGVFEGKSAALLALHAGAREELWAVDVNLREEAIERALGAIRPLPDPRIQLVRGDSFLLHKHRSILDHERAFRFLHIDGEHSSAALTNDLDLAHRFASESALVCLDDMFSVAYPHLTETLFRYLARHPERFVPILFGYNKGFLARPRFAHAYLDYVNHGLQDRLDALGQETTLFKTNTPAELNAFGIMDRGGFGRRRGLDDDQDALYH